MFPNVHSLHREMDRMHRDLTGLFAMLAEPSRPQEQDRQRSLSNDMTRPHTPHAGEGDESHQQMQVHQLPSTVAKLHRSTIPCCDIVERENEIELHAELPGIRKEDISVEVKDGVLSFSGNYRETRDEEDENHKWRLRERHTGKFHRSFRLPENARTEDISARCVDGMLKLTVPLLPASKPQTHSIEIQ